MKEAPVAINKNIQKESVKKYKISKHVPLKWDMSVCIAIQTVTGREWMQKKD